VRVFGHVDPDQPVAFDKRVFADADLGRLHAFFADERWDVRALTRGFEAPAVIGALDRAIQDLTFRQRHAAVRAEVAQRERFAALGAAKDDRLAEQCFVQEFARFQRTAVQREIPNISQEKRGLDVLQAHDVRAQCQSASLPAKAANRARVNGPRRCQEQL